MMKNKFPVYLTDVYPFHAATGTFTIPVTIEHLDELFNQLDHSPIRRKDLSADLVSFLQECSTEIPPAYNLEIAIHITGALAEKAKEVEVLSGIHHYFSYLANRIRQEMRRKRRRAIKYILFSFTFITAAVLTTPIMSRSVLFEIINEGLHIGGWVFLWEAFSVNFIAMDATQADIRRAERLFRAPVRFSYERLTTNNDPAAPDSMA
jgi:hypothetical protein